MTSLAGAVDEVRSKVARDMLAGPPAICSDASEEKSSTSKPNDDSSEDLECKPQPLLPKSAILRLLAEMVRSYAGCAQLLAQFSYQAGDSALVTEDCSALAFILDRLLPQGQTAGDKDCPALARVLMASLSACNHCPEGQATLVTELRAALQRALALPESLGKHSRLLALTSLFIMVIEACPASSGSGQSPVSQVFKGQHVQMNNIVRLMLKKGLVQDLARIPHALDLSSPHMAYTVNSALKPLETLSRIVNQPQPVPSPKGGKPKADQAQASGGLQEMEIEDSARTFVDAYTALAAQHGE